jgi:hypothetical protein
MKALDQIKQLSDALPPVWHGQPALQAAIAEIERLSAPRDAVLDEAADAVQAVRHKIAATFEPACSGQRGQDKTDVLYDAQVAIRALKNGHQQLLSSARTANRQK